MFKERIKSAILILLILNCLQLTGQIWFNKKLWPSGYNFFTSVRNTRFVSALSGYLPFVNKRDIADGTYLSTVRPSKIVVSSGNAREVYYPGEEKYNSAYLVADDILSLVSATQPVRSAVTSVDEFYTYLQSKSIYLSYGFGIDNDSLSEVFKKSFSSVLPGSFNVSDILVTSDSLTKEGIVCMLDANVGSVVKFWAEHKGDEITRYIDSVTYTKALNKMFAYELKLDRLLSETVNTSIKQRSLLNSKILLAMESEQLPEIIAFNPLNWDTNRFDNIVSALGCTPSSLRKSVSQDGVASYVENSATIRISPLGIVEYNAVETDKGIPLPTGFAEPYTAMTEVLNIAEGIFEVVNVEEPPDLHLVYDLKRTDEEIIIKMNYTFGGIPVISQIKEENVLNAVYARVQNGYITSFKMLLRTFEMTENDSTLMPGINALDKLVTQEGREGVMLEVLDVFKCYGSEDGQGMAMWGFKIKDSESVVLIPNQ